MSQALKETIILTASYYGKALDPGVLAMYIDDLSDFTPEEVMIAYRKYRKDPKNKFFPLPAQIIEIIQPSISPDAEAQMASARIYEAIGKFGWCNGKEAQIYIGPLGWRVVKRMGGWTQVCETVGVNYERSAFIAHTKNIAKAEREYIKAGHEDARPQLNYQPNDLFAAIDFKPKNIED